MRREADVRAQMTLNFKSHTRAPPRRRRDAAAMCFQCRACSSFALAQRGVRCAMYAVCACHERDRRQMFTVVIQLLFSWRVYIYIGFAVTLRERLQRITLIDLHITSSRVAWKTSADLLAIKAAADRTIRLSDFGVNN